MLKKSLRIFLGFEGKNVNENEISELLLAFYSEAMRWSRAGVNFSVGRISIQWHTWRLMGGFRAAGGLKKLFCCLSVLDACFSAVNTKIYIFVCWIKFIQEFCECLKERPRPISPAAWIQELRKFEAARYRSYGIANRGRLNGSIVLNGEGKCASYFNWMRSRAI